MPLVLKLLLSILIIGVQVVLVIVFRRVSTATLRKWGFMSCRGEDVSSYLREAGEELRRSPDSDQRMAAVPSFLGVIVILTALLVIIWLV